ncbi:hypothetical protein IFM89_022115, partial [Coptis chinensis]
EVIFVEHHSLLYDILRVMKRCSRLSKIFSTAMVHELYRIGMGETTFDKLALTLSRLCASNGESFPGWDTLLKVGVKRRSREKRREREELERKQREDQKKLRLRAEAKAKKCSGGGLMQRLQLKPKERGSLRENRDAGLYKMEFSSMVRKIFTYTRKEQKMNQGTLNSRVGRKSCDCRGKKKVLRKLFHCRCPLRTSPEPLSFSHMASLGDELKESIAKVKWIMCFHRRRKKLNPRS